MAPSRGIYLDYQATTPVDPRVLEAMLPWFTKDFGNPASHSHRFGWRAEAAVEVAREEIAAGIGARDPREVIFTSGATESDNLALQGVVAARGGAGTHIVSVATEHPAVLDTCAALSRRGVSVTLLPVDREGRLDPAAVEQAITPDTVLVSVMAANNEIGILHPLAEIGRICERHRVLLHSDAAQAVGKVPLDVEALGIDLLSISAHKLYGPKGIGALFVRRRCRFGGRLRIEPILYGGGHERGLRSGTLPTPQCVGFGRAIALAASMREEESRRVAGLRDQLLVALQKALPGLVQLNGPPPGEQRLPGNLNLSLEGVEADALLARLEDVAISSGSACSSARPEPSHVLRALGLPEARIRAALRFGLGRGTTQEEVAQAADRVAQEARKLREARAGHLAGAATGR